MAFRFVCLVAAMTACSSASPIETPALAEEADSIPNTIDLCVDESSQDEGCPPPDFDSR